MVGRARGLSVVLSILLLAVIGGASQSVAGTTVATKMTDEESDRNTTKTESRPLWSRDVDNQSSTRNVNESSLEQIATGSDVTYAEPPASAAEWTHNAFERLPVGDTQTSVAPEHANLVDGRFIRDAHATVFSVHPSTTLHRSPNQVVRYVGSDGHLRALIDYRVRTPDTTRSGNTTRTWNVQESHIGAIELWANDERVASQRGTQTPILSFDSLPETDALEVRATIHVRGEERVRRTRTVCRDENESRHCEETVDTEVSPFHESIDVSDTIAVTTYNLDPGASFIQYPNGDLGIGVSQSTPWAGLRTDNNITDVRGTWRFYTARDTNWDSVIRRSEFGSTIGQNRARPVFVHAFPSVIGSTSTGIGEVTGTQGPELRSPEETIGANVHVSVVETAYQPANEMAIRTDSTDRIAVTGIVRGSEVSIPVPADLSAHSFETVELLVTVLRQNASTATIQVQLTDAETGEPIHVGASDRARENAHPSGYLEIENDRITVNDSGIATYTVSDPGAYTVTFHPNTWTRAETAYHPTSATVRWHPLWEPSTWTHIVNLGGGTVLFVGLCDLTRRTIGAGGNQSGGDGRW